jgi:hypothetical protein
MFGNIAGWIGALLIVVVVYFVTLHSYLFPSASEPSPEVQTEEFLKQHDITESVALVVGAAPTGPGNAADDYKQAINTYNTPTYMDQVREFDRMWQRKEDDLKFDRTNIRERISHLDGAEKRAEQDRLLAEVWAEYNIEIPSIVGTLQKQLAAGAKKKEMRYVESYGPDTPDVHIETEQSSRLVQMAMFLQKIHRYQIRKGQADQAIEPLKNQVILGWHMYNEHADVQSMFRGLQIQQTAMDMLEEIYATKGENSKITQMKPYQDHIDGLERYVREKHGILWFVLIQNGNPGDVYYLIENDQDPAWRKRAVLTLGMLKFMPCLHADKLVIRRKIIKYCESDDPLVKSSAEASRDFTRKEYNRLGAPKYPGN